MGRRSNGVGPGFPDSHGASSNAVQQQLLLESDPSHIAFLAKSLGRNDTEFAALEKLHGQLRQIRELIVSKYGEAALFPDYFETYAKHKSKREGVNASIDRNEEGGKADDDDEAELRSLLQSFRIRLQLRRRLLNRLCRRLNRVAHFMDGEVANVVTPTLPKFGDVPFEDAHDPDKQRDIEDYSATKTRAIETQKKLHQLRLSLPTDEERYRLDALVTSVVANTGIEAIDALSAPERTLLEEKELKEFCLTRDELLCLRDHDVGYDKLAIVTTKTSTTISPVASSPLPNADDPDVIGSLTPKFGETKHSTSSVIIKPAVGDAEDNERPEYSRITRSNPGIGSTARASAMSFKEKEIEHQRWAQELLSQVVEQPTFDELGQGLTDPANIFLGEQRRARIAKELGLKSEDIAGGSKSTSKETKKEKTDEKEAEPEVTSSGIVLPPSKDADTEEMQDTEMTLADEAEGQEKGGADERKDIHVYETEKGSVSDIDSSKGKTSVLDQTVLESKKAEESIGNPISAAKQNKSVSEGKSAIEEDEDNTQAVDSALSSLNQEKEGGGASLSVSVSESVKNLKMEAATKENNTKQSAKQSAVEHLKAEDLETVKRNEAMEDHSADRVTTADKESNKVELYVEGGCNLERSEKKSSISELDGASGQKEKPLAIGADVATAGKDPPGSSPKVKQDSVEPASQSMSSPKKDALKKSEVLSAPSFSAVNDPIIKWGSFKVIPATSPKDAISEKSGGAKTGLSVSTSEAKQDIQESMTSDMDFDEEKASDSKVGAITQMDTTETSQDTPTPTEVCKKIQDASHPAALQNKDSSVDGGKDKQQEHTAEDGACKVDAKESDKEEQTTEDNAISMDVHAEKTDKQQREEAQGNEDDLADAENGSEDLKMAEKESSKEDKNRQEETDETDNSVQEESSKGDKNNEGERKRRQDEESPRNGSEDTCEGKKNALSPSNAADVSKVQKGPKEKGDARSPRSPEKNKRISSLLVSKLQKKKARLSLQPVPSFAEQDLSRIKAIQSQLIALSVQELARKRVDEATAEYNATVKKSTELQSMKIRLQQDVQTLDAATRAKAQKLRSDFALEVTLARNNWQRQKDDWEATKKARLYARLQGRLSQNGYGLASLEGYRDPCNPFERNVSARSAVLQTFQGLMSGVEQKVRATGSRRMTNFSSVDAASEVAKFIGRTGRDQTYPNPATTPTFPFHVDLNLNSFPKFQAPSPPPELDPTYLAKKQEETQNLMMKQIRIVEEKFNASEEERKRAWRKLQKFKNEFEHGNTGSYSQQRSSHNTQSASSYHHSQSASSTRHRQQNSSGGGVTSSRASSGRASTRSSNTSETVTSDAPTASVTSAHHRSTSPQITYQSTAQVENVSVAHEHSRPEDTSMVGDAHGNRYAGKYTVEKVRERIFPDGSVKPVTMPKKNEHGLYYRPAGRQRKGMDWDAVNGRWVPIPGQQPRVGVPSSFQHQQSSP